jgi:sugar (pentulose or hexulose) kinase
MFIGIDVGTQGARVVLMDGEGRLMGSREEAFVLSAASREEQSPEMWWEACRRCMSSLLLSVGTSGVKSIAVTSTSGTVIPLDSGHRPLHAALMYSDKRSVLEGEVCTAEAVAGVGRRGGYTAFNSSSGLSKMVWYVRHYPAVAEKIRYWVHAADYITSKLCGRWGITDYTNALKSGFDLHREEWPAYIYEKLPLRKEWLPEVVASGSPVGVVLTSLAREWGLSSSVQVVAPMTDGCASQLASGAVDRGCWNTTLGTTLVVKGVTEMELADEEGRFYSHRHPDGGWMPGGASNTGADWVREFPVIPEVDRLIPTGLRAFPLRQEGERFPFVAPQARGFAPEGVEGPLLFAANMEGVAYVERFAYELAERLSGEKIKAVYTAGGGSNSHTWLVIRSSVLGLPIYKMRYVTGAAGAAMLAASRVYFGTVGEAVRSMARIEKEVAPEEGLRGRYEEGYGKWVEEMRGRGIIGI